MSNRPGMVQNASSGTQRNGLHRRAARLHWPLRRLNQRFRGAVRQGALYAAFGMALSLGLAACHTAPTTPAVVAAPVVPAKPGLSDTQVELLKQQGFIRTTDGWMLRLSDKLLFDTAESRLRGESRELIAQLGTTLHSAGIDHIKILGYTDSLGSDDYNAALSLRRAKAVADVLTRAGMPRAGLTASGMGKQDPIGDNQTANGRALNRRVAIIVDMPS